MSIRFDKYVVGDMVEWDESFGDCSRRDNLGEGPFEVLQVYDRESRTYYGESYDEAQSIMKAVTFTDWQSMGHTQHLVIEQSEMGKPDNHMQSQFSGAWFKPLRTPGRR